MARATRPQRAVLAVVGRCWPLLAVVARCCKTAALPQPCGASNACRHPPRPSPRALSEARPHCLLLLTSLSHSMPAWRCPVPADLSPADESWIDRNAVSVSCSSIGALAASPLVCSSAGQWTASVTAAAAAAVPSDDYAHFLYAIHNAETRIDDSNLTSIRMRKKIHLPPSPASSPLLLPLLPCFSSAPTALSATDNRPLSPRPALTPARRARAQSSPSPPAPGRVPRR